MRLLVLLLVGCVGNKAGRPENLYDEPPAERRAVVIGEVTARVCLYGDADAGGGYRKVSERTKDRAAIKLWDKAAALGADAVIEVRTEGGCTPRIAIDPLCNCVADAKGTAVKWSE